ncbi:MAG: TonB-dependent receptor [Pedobacter sp.]|nr:MAG: TonB-dependent receptor [Pedobacter sp.]
MNKLFTKIILAILVLATSFSVSYAQNVVVSGKVTDKLTSEAIPGASVTIKGTSTGATTNESGMFSFSTPQSTPFTIIVSFLGYKSLEREITGSTSNLTFALEAEAILGQEVVISASRTPERILESPVTIERMGVAQIREVAAPSFYDAIQNIKGVEMSTQSLTFRSYNTRGFNANGNTRFNQLIDGMDNQAPGLNFAVGNIVGITELDVENVELLPGASSALYGAGGISGTLLMTSKDPFRYQGVSAQYKTGINHVDDPNSSAKPFNQFDLRMAKSWNNKFGVKLAFSFLQAKDWYGTNYSNFDRINNRPKAGTRASDPGYDGVNVYGDEVNSSILGVSKAVLNAFATSPTGAPAYAAFGQLMGAGLTYPQIVATVNGNPAYAALRPAIPYLGVMYSLAKNTTSNQIVSRTGYNEMDLVDYDTESLKLSTGLYYNITDKVQLTAQANWGTGTSVYTGSDRYSLRNFNIGLYKLELKGEDFYVRGYTTQERSGDSYISSILGSYVNEMTAGSASTWFPTYSIAYSAAKSQGASEEAAHAAARAQADATRVEAGSPEFNQKAAQIKSTYISDTNFDKDIYGAKFNDKSNLYHYEGMYNFSRLLNNAVELQVGASTRNYDLNSGGTIFDDKNREIDIRESAVFGQMAKKFGALKISVAGRYDKSKNFEGRFTPRVTGVWTVAPNSNIRASFQTGFRNPTTQNQYIDLSVGGGSQRLIGGLPEFLNKYNLYTNKGFTEDSYRAYLNSVITSPTGTGNATLLKQYTFDAKGVRPESVVSYELGFKSLLNQNLLLDVYGYMNEFKDFISAVNVYQNVGGSFVKFGVPVNVEGKVKSYGGALGLDYIIGKYNLTGNVSYNKLGEIPLDYENDFNTPEIRFNLGFGNREIIKNIGYNINYRWQDKFTWNSSFAGGEVEAFGTLDAQVNFKMPSLKSVIKVGGSNILNKYYITSYGNPQAGAMYYVSLAFNP